MYNDDNEKEFEVPTDDEVKEEEEDELEGLDGFRIQSDTGENAEDES